MLNHRRGNHTEEQSRESASLGTIISTADSLLVGRKEMWSTGYNPRKQMIACKRALILVAVWFMTGSFLVRAGTNREQPVSSLAKQIAAITGPGPVKLTIRNHSSLSVEEIPAIRAMLERDLRGLGILASGSDSATSIRVTLSENAAGGLWVAEVQEGTEVRVVMVPVDLGTTAVIQAGSGIMLRKTLLWQQMNPVLDLMIAQAGDTRRMIVLEPERIVVYVTANNGWVKEQELAIVHSRPFPRDVRGLLVAGQGQLFEAYLPGVECTGADRGGTLKVSCSDSDDPWPLQNAVQQKAFYNATRNYFTGALAPGIDMQLQPFYSATMISRPDGTAMLFNGVDGKVAMVESNILKPIAGARDWGSDLAAIRSGCNSATQVLVSASGAASTDSVRAYEIPGREAEPVSAPLPMDGPVMAMRATEDGASARIVVRTAATYEVYGVSALCN